MSKRLRKLIPAIAALALMGVLYAVAGPPQATAAQRQSIAARYHFTQEQIALPAGIPDRKVRYPLHPEYMRIQNWMSSVGSAVAVSDIDGDGLSNDLCLDDTRNDKIMVTPAPGAGSNRYQPFILNPAPLPEYGAPAGCSPIDANEDGVTDLLVYYGLARTPIMYLAKTGVKEMSPARFKPVEVVPQKQAADGKYHGPFWQNFTVNFADFDGDGHLDLFVGGYFPERDATNARAKDHVEFMHSLSKSLNGSDDHVLRWTGATSGPDPTVSYQEAKGVLKPNVSKGWALASAITDLDGDMLPELYIANDFGPDHLLWNRSTAGHIKFQEVQGVRQLGSPKSKVLGHDSFKGMGAEVGDLNGDAKPDLFVSDITSPFAFLESNLAFVNTARDKADVRKSFQQGVAPFEDHSTGLGIAWSGWSWDAKQGDFDNDGTPEMIQATGYIDGDKADRWPQMQELATMHDELSKDLRFWPYFKEGDYIDKDEPLRFWAKGSDGRFTDVGGNLGVSWPHITRGIAMADTDGDGKPEFLVSRQWRSAVFFHNEAPENNNFLGLRLFHPLANGAKGSPAVGTQIKVTTSAGHTMIGQIDGGNGHAGKRAQEALFGLGKATGAKVSLSWRDLTGQIHEQELSLNPGWHTLILGTDAREVAPKS